MRTHILTALKTAAFLCAGLLFATDSVLHAQPTAYVTNIYDDTVTPIDIATNTAGTPIAVGSRPYAVAITPDGATAYVANFFEDTVTPIDIATNTAGTPIFVDSISPYGVAITPDGTTAYVIAWGYDDADITPIDIASNTAGTPFSASRTAYGIAITLDGATAYVVNNVDSQVAPVDLATHIVGPPIAVGLFPRGIAITPDGTTAYVVNGGDNTVTPIDIATKTAGTPVAVGREPRGIAITPDGATAYVTNTFYGTVTPIDIATNTAGPPIAVGRDPLRVAITPDGATAYVTNFLDDTVTPIDIATNTAGTPISVGAGPRGIAITPTLPTSDLMATCTPVSPPITVPAGGGAFAFNIEVVNNGATAATFDMWIDINGPGVNRTRGPVTRTLAPSASLSRALNQNVPGGAPAGEYTHTCNVGTFPVAAAGSSFGWTKSSSLLSSDVVVASWSTDAVFEAQLEGAANAVVDIPGTHVLEAAYPNPFNPEATFQFGVSEQQNVRADLVDVSGRVVATLFEGNVEAGEMQTVRIDGAGLPSGTYVVRVVGETFADARSVTLLK